MFELLLCKFIISECGAYKCICTCVCTQSFIIHNVSVCSCCLLFYSLLLFHSFNLHPTSPLSSPPLSPLPLSSSLSPLPLSPLPLSPPPSLSPPLSLPPLSLPLACSSLVGGVRDSSPPSPLIVTSCMTPPQAYWMRYAQTELVDVR